MMPPLELRTPAILGRRLAVALLASVLCGPAAAAPPEVQDLGAGQYQVTFVYDAPAGTKSVHLAGTFNGWSMSALPMTGPDDAGQFRLAMQLARGRYEYKYVVNESNWQGDPDNPIKFGPYGNSVLLVGVTAEEGELGANDASPPGSPASSQPVNMAARTAHPPEVEALAAALRGLDLPRSMVAFQEWIKGRALPLVHPESVTFVVADLEADVAHLYVYGVGYWTTYEMPRLLPEVPVFALSLERKSIPDGSVYRSLLEGNGSTRAVVDPFAWSITSRDGEPAAVVRGPDPARGRVQLVRSVADSAGSVATRDLYVYLPPGYDAAADTRYPVLYMHDGQNCWDDPVQPFGHGGWQVNAAADRLIAAGRVRPFIAVGIPNTLDRLPEYGTGPDLLSPDAQPYIRYIIRDVKAAVERRYRTQPGPGGAFLMGSSMGATVSLQAALLHPEAFGGAACLSPALWFEDPNGRNYFDLLARTGKVPVRLYVYTGTGGPAQDGAPDTRRLAQALRDAGWSEGTDLRYEEEPGAEHNERAWRARLDEVLRFLIGR